MPYFTFETEVEELLTPLEFVEACTDLELRELDELLSMKTGTYTADGVHISPNASLAQEEFYNSLRKLKKNYFSLSSDCLETINKVASRL